LCGAENQLARVVKNGSEVARYAYDPIGRRIEKLAGGVTTTWLYDREDILRQTVGTTVTTYIHGPGVDEPLASETAAGVRTYLHADGLGSVVKTTNSSGAAVSTFKYNAFGVLESGAPAPYAFTGREWEAESGLYYYRARYYDPKIGRFISEDPIGFDGGINFYLYVRNNPVNATDPSGLKIQVCQRKAELAPMRAVNGNHSYFWDPRPHSSMTPRDCGKGTIGGSPATTGVEHPDPMTTECYDVEGSDGLEDQLMICCRAAANLTVSTCWGGLGTCLDAYGLKMPPGTHMFGCTGTQCSK
jgi:RHS repeat-associated protein